MYFGQYLMILYLIVNRHLFFFHNSFFVFVIRWPISANATNTFPNTTQYYRGTTRLLSKHNIVLLKLNTILSKLNTILSKHNIVGSKHNTMSSKHNTVSSKPGAYEQEHATQLYFCHGVFIYRFTFRSNLLWMRLPWESHNQSQDTNWRHCVTGPELLLVHKRKGCTKNRLVCKNAVTKA